MNIDLNGLFDFIAKYTLTLNVLALLVFTIATLTFRGFKPKFHFTSYSLVMVLVITLDVIHRQIEAAVMPLFGVEEYKSIIGVLWYMSFAITDLILVAVAAFAIRKFDLFRDRASAILLFAYMFLACVQMFTFFDTSIAKAYILYDFYPTLVVSSNVFVSVVACCYALRAVLIRLNSTLLFFIRR